MKYTERPEFPCDPEVFKLQDTVTAMLIYDEAVRKHGGIRPPCFLEVERAIEKMDPIWATTPSGEETIKRQMWIPALNRTAKKKWMPNKAGFISPQDQDDFILSHKSLVDNDYWPFRGDYVFWNGYTYMIVSVDIEAESIFHQTNVWLGLVVRCTIAPQGDGKVVFPTPQLKAEQTKLPILSTTQIGADSPPDASTTTI